MGSGSGKRKVRSRKNENEMNKKLLNTYTTKKMKERREKAESSNK